MQQSDLLPVLSLLRRVLDVEIKQGYRNRSTTGVGIHGFFRLQFDRMEHDESTAVTAQGILAYLRRYEGARSVEERAQIASIMLRRLDATEARYRAVAADAPSPPPAPPTPSVEPRSSTPPVGLESAARSAHGLVPDPEPPRPSAPLREAAGVLRGDDAPMSEHARQEGPAVLEGTPEPDEEEYDEEDEDDPSWSLAPPVTGSSAPAQGSPARAGTGDGVSADGGLLERPAVLALEVRSQEAPRLERLGIATLRSAIEYWPRDHTDYSNPVRINRMMPDMQTTLIGTLRSVDVRRIAGKNLQIVEAKVQDPTGLMSVSWFNQPYLARTLKPRVGEQIAISGKVEQRPTGGLQLAPQEVEFPADDEDGTNTRRILPVYPSSEGISQRWIRKLIGRALDAGVALMPDPLPAELRREFRLPERRAAIRQYHFPDSLPNRDRARNRLALDELLLIQLGMQQRKREWQGPGEGRAIPIDAAVLSAFRQSLPFTLTGAQDRALAAILDDMGRAVPMSRLLQGDVGSGKTVVAAAALLLAARAGYQGAIMAPTEILAEQHARTLGAMLEPHGVSVALLTGSLSKAQRARLYLDAYQGKVQVLAGTHALIQEGFKFDNLGLAIVDEQHRFGVVQRAALKGKGFNPHLLVMTATPIPRTLTLTMYGDLDVSVIDERPPNRRPVETRWVPLDREAYALIREQVAEGRQAYIICPLVEESEALEVKAAVAEEKRLQAEVFPDLRLGLLHGKLKSQEKESVLARFRDGEIQVLVATSVVEVGIDVPNATVMVVQDAQRFGLAQLHQFRGRVGRGAAQSYCILLAEAKNPVAIERLTAMCATDDGFKLAEEDLRLRGPGEFWGTRQSGMPALQVAQVTDTPTLDLARRVAESILSDDPGLALPQHALLADTLRHFWERAAEPS